MGNVKLNDLYQEVLSIESAIEQMELDIMNSECELSVKCILEKDLVRTKSAYRELLNSEFSFKDISFDDYILSLNRCLECIDLSI
ncbi:hypothetical protein [Bacillus horti]|uniref:Uncharacterized protein n=1 Tax=Caldalkalibacillus horti TaxID=77523 RepID=A0ABT9VVZ3_9BACI|nr:hypothetical protein [Bacillus horti]MDQ0165166.1 hypothetical protein [Bacillus horti]